MDDFRDLFEVGTVKIARNGKNGGDDDCCRDCKNGYENRGKRREVHIPFGYTDQNQRNGVQNW